MVSFIQIITILSVALGASVSEAAFVNPSTQHAVFRQSTFPSSRIVPTGTTTSTPTATRTTTPVVYRETNTAHSMLDMNSLVLATIDADIANIDDNKFGLVFAGGIAVMVGGVLSALIVGFILERGDLYAKVVADSYVQGAQDEEFWKGLSEEETKKTRELLAKVKASKGGNTASSTVIETTEGNKTPTVFVSEEKKEVGMFSDYGDDS
jgi:hypothetical protein